MKFRKRPLLISLLAALTALAASHNLRSEEEKGLTLGPSTLLRFASVEESQHLLRTPDEFTKRLSPFDICVRMNVAEPLPMKDFLERVASSALEWEQSERQHVEAALEKLRPTLDKLELPLPKTILLIKTNGREEAGAAYTRQNGIIFHPGVLKGDAKQFSRLLAHELFHVISRNSSKLRDQLYKIIGFEPCNEIAFPASLRGRKITNPDAPVNAHFIRLKIAGREMPVPAVPVLMASQETIDSEANRSLFSYLTVQFLVIEQIGDKWRPGKNSENDPDVVAMARAGNYRELVGANTNYTIHPEEIIADNFAFLATGKKDLPSPKIIEEMRKVLSP